MVLVNVILTGKLNPQSCIIRYNLDIICQRPMLSLILAVHDYLAKEHLHMYLNDRCD